MPTRSAVPTRAPIPAVTPIATAPQTSTLDVARSRGAPPSRAPVSPSRARAIRGDRAPQAPLAGSGEPDGGERQGNRPDRERQRRSPCRLQRVCPALFVEAELVACVGDERVAAGQRDRDFVGEGPAGAPGVRRCRACVLPRARQSALLVRVQVRFPRFALGAHRHVLAGRPSTARPPRVRRYRR